MGLCKTIKGNICSAAWALNPWACAAKALSHLSLKVEAEVLVAALFGGRLWGPMTQHLEGLW